MAMGTVLAIELQEPENAQFSGESGARYNLFDKLIACFQVTPRPSLRIY